MGWAPLYYCTLCACYWPHYYWRRRGNLPQTYQAPALSSGEQTKQKQKQKLSRVQLRRACSVDLLLAPVVLKPSNARRIDFRLRCSHCCCFGICSACASTVHIYHPSPVTTPVNSNCNRLIASKMHVNRNICNSASAVAGVTRPITATEKHHYSFLGDRRGEYTVMRCLII